VKLADAVVVGDGEAALPLCLSHLENVGKNRGADPLLHCSKGAPELWNVPPDLASISLADQEYSDHDIKHRLIYVEASRGCTYGCQFCLSAREPAIRRFPEELVLQSLQRLWERGVRQFKFVDRALHLVNSPAILNFFLERMEPKVFVHFEVVPEAVPHWSWPLLAAFPEGQLQLEAGVQSLDEAVCARINRRQNAAGVLKALARLKAETRAHIHADLVLGLPGDTIDGIAASFDQLLSAAPDEIQVGILKRLRGAPIAIHDQPFDMRYSPFPPYEVLATSTLDFLTVQRLKRFARYFDLVFNSGDFPHASKALLAADSPFCAFLRFSDWLFETVGQTSGIARDRLCELLFRFMVEQLNYPESQALETLSSDYEGQGKPLPASIARRQTGAKNLDGSVAFNLSRRQRKHLRTSDD